MKSEYHFFKGKSLYSHLLKPDIEYRRWSQQLVLTPESADLFLKLKESTPECEGILNDLKSTEDGYTANFSRPMSKDFGGGKEELLTPPIILDANNEPWPDNVLIGNGSDITVKVELYKYNIKFKKGKKGSAIRLVSARIDNLVPYEMKKDFTEEQLKAVEGLPEQPAQPF